MQPSAEVYLLKDAQQAWGADAGLALPWATSNPRSVYLHIPFCAHRCGYCNFAVTQGREDMFEEYLVALEHELAGLAHKVEVDTIFLGGGTPTILPLVMLERMLKLVQRHFEFARGYEWTIEANPNDVSDELCKTLLDAGVNRISLGVQSFDDRKLQALDRTHDASKARSAIDILLKYFDNVSVDLIFAAPEETALIWTRDLQTIGQLGVPHVSTYGLTIEKGTQFFNAQQKHQLTKPVEEIELWMYEHALQVLGDIGYEHYEISNFAKPGYQCRHNHSYWNLAGWWAFGAGAARSVGRIRSTNHPSTRTYIRMIQQGRLPIHERQELTHFEWTIDAMVFGMRTRRGVKLDYIERVGDSAARLAIEESIGEMIDQHFLERHDGFVRLTPKGLVVSDSIWTYLYAGAARAKV